MASRATLALKSAPCCLRWIFLLISVLLLNYWAATLSYSSIQFSGYIIIVALPNVLHWKQRLEFLKGHFKYTEGGLMDRTHFRFFDWQTAQDLLTQSGYQITQAEADGSFPLPVLRKLLPTPISQGIMMYPGNCTGK
jgi:hypothetical protein